MKPIEVAGFGANTYSVRDSLRISHGIEKPVFDAAYAMAGIKDPLTEVQYMEGMNSVIYHIVALAEDSGYVPEGEGWKYMRDGRFGLDGDKPFNLSGGKNSFAHPSSASGGINIAEAVYQMRGDAGARQMKVPPKVSTILGAGGGATQCAVVLRSL